MIAITGHTEGIGKALSNVFTDAGYQVKGYALETGHDILDESVRVDIIKEVVEEKCSCFINNAYAKDAQLELLLLLFQHWRNDPHKTIINIGTLATDIPVYTERMIPYVARKMALKQAIYQLQRRPHLCRIIHVKFGFVDTAFSKSVISEKVDATPVLTTEQAANFLYPIFIDSSIYIQEVSVTARRK